MSQVVDDPAARAALEPFLEGNLLAWRGLPDLSLGMLSAALGSPTQREVTQLGWYAAERYRFPSETPSGGLAAYVRENKVVLVEALAPPPLAAMEGLPEPCAIKPHEILAPDAYVYEYLYCERGLVLSVAEPFQKGPPRRLVRCRGIRPLHSPEEFGPELYQAFQDKIAW